MAFLDIMLKLPLYLDRAVIAALLECLVIHEVCRLWNEAQFRRVQKLLLSLIVFFGLLFALFMLKRAYQLIPL